MATLDIKRVSAKYDAVQVFQVVYAGSETHAALLDVYVPTTGDSALTIHVGKPGAGLAGAVATSGRAKTKIAILGDQAGAMELPDGAALVEHVSHTSVAGYVGPRLMRFIARTHGSALAS